MKILLKNLKAGIIKIKVENLDDLWYLSQTIEKGDRIKGLTIRKIKMGGEEDRKRAIVTKKVKLEIATEKVEFIDGLRALGKITAGPDDVTHGSYHTFNIEPGSEIQIIKRWPLYQLKRLDEAVKAKGSIILIVAMDREHATIALLERSGVRILTQFSGNVHKKGDPDDNVSGEGFYSQLGNILKEYIERYNASKAVVGSPAFFKEDFAKKIDPEIKKKIILATCHDSGKNGVQEILRRPELKKALEDDRVSQEMALVEQLLENISKGKLSGYGIVEVEKHINSGAAQSVIVTEGLIKKMRKDNTYQRLDYMLKNAESIKAEVHIISSEHDGGNKLDGLGGIGAILRYDIH
ncbi:mRNA surveillance protein pelota [Candidatus Woesearchaeota archaeon]|nr:mRNA surveillance protein pelota [Candidatus Woesearchaeota archaeon]